jgi:ZIP family zinc transporter
VIDWFVNLNPVIQAFIGSLFMWSLTIAGAGSIIILKDVSRRFLNGMLGFAAGVMIAASFWSLLAPAIELTRQNKTLPVWFPASVGFVLGCLFLWSIDNLLPHLHPGYPLDDAEGKKTSWERSVLLVLAITLHNIPEGLAVGVAFGAAGAGLKSATLASAVALTIGMGIQNFPEGLAVSAPLRREGYSCSKCFYYGQLSGIVEPIACIFGAFAVLLIRPLLPYALAFAAGAMIYVVIEELIPESQMEKETHSATLGAVIGFVLMMILDLGL